MTAVYAPDIAPSEAPQPGEDLETGLARIRKAFWARVGKTMSGANRASVASSEKLGGASHAP
jgi:hypothetical protein